MDAKPMDSKANLFHRKSSLVPAEKPVVFLNLKLPFPNKFFTKAKRIIRHFNLI